ncbi:uncharacterized protein AMSG_02515 [Thecamonas trahens ATCC 50062]|uniref:Uncharacterized protein n=1 Tax=Thecamonas trahens ATCC 50062 TaxID=461836 RepID=A0A0L0D868_THETB|nr:hypothetical protein AMSG_02515 [Thecamonas trahens ATCC 50062]KNC47498.1 hypothetical protein AMSG_02515 [Thecamonas trahens ATCC 50062]|eukprot:XP_013759434.1 hypothetical protein AMSG_02515 [Thecamonas trahens ATCC 50062]
MYVHAGLQAKAKDDVVGMIESLVQSREQLERSLPPLLDKVVWAVGGVGAAHEPAALDALIWTEAQLAGAIDAVLETGSGMLVVGMLQAYTALAQRALMSVLAGGESENPVDARARTFVVSTLPQNMGKLAAAARKMSFARKASGEIELGAQLQAAAAAIVSQAVGNGGNAASPHPALPVLRSAPGFVELVAALQSEGVSLDTDWGLWYVVVDGAARLAPTAAAMDEVFASVKARVAGSNTETSSRWSWLKARTLVALSGSAERAELREAAAARLAARTDPYLARVVVRAQSCAGGCAWHREALSAQAQVQRLQFELESGSTVSTARYMRLRTSHDAVKGELTELRAALEGGSESARLAGALEEVNSLKYELARAQAAFAHLVGGAATPKLKTELAQLRAAKAERDVEHAALQAAYDELRAQTEPRADGKIEEMQDANAKYAKSCKRLEARVAELEKQMREAKSGRNAAQSKLELLSSQHDALKGVLACKSGELDQASQAAERFAARAAVLEAENSELGAELTATTQKMRKALAASETEAHTQLLHVRMELQIARRELAEAHSTIASLQSENEAAATASSRIQSELSEMAAENETLLAERDKAHTTIAALQTQAQVAADANDAIQTELSDVISENETLIAERDELASTVERLLCLKGDLEGTQVALNAYEAEVADARQRMSDAEAEIEDACEALEAEQLAHNATLTELEQAKRQLESAQLELQECFDSLNAKQTAVAKAKLSMQAMEADINDARFQITAITEEKKVLEAELDGAMAHNEEMEAVVEDALAEADAAKADNAQLKEAVAKKDAEIVQAKDTIVLMEEAVAHKDAHIGQVETDAAATAAELADLRTTYQEIETAMNATTRKLLQRNMACDELREELAALQRRFDKKNEEHTVLHESYALMEDIVAKLKTEDEFQRTRIAELETEVQKRHTALAEVSASLAQAGDVIESDQAELKALHAEFDHLQGEHARVVQALEKSRAANSELQDELKARARRLADVEAKHASLRELLSSP